MAEEPALLTLRVSRGPVEGAELVAKPPAQIIGRTRAARQLQIKDPNVSERHAELAWRDGAWRLRDLGSSNGTCVNGAELPRQGEARTLQNGDVILFGEFSEVVVDITSAPDDGQTVAAYIQAEATRQEQRLRAKAEQLENALRQDWHRHAQKLQAT